MFKQANKAPIVSLNKLFAELLAGSAMDQAPDQTMTFISERLGLIAQGHPAFGVTFIDDEGQHIGSYDREIMLGNPEHIVNDWYGEWICDAGLENHGAEDAVILSCECWREIRLVSIEYEFVN